MPNSMHRHNAVITNASLPVPQQARVDAHHMLVVRIGKGLVGKVNSLIEKSLRLLFSHQAIVGQGGVVGHSYFPSVVLQKIFAFFVPETTGNSHVA